MSTIKKAFQPIVTLLSTAMSANADATIASVMDEVTALASAKSGSGGGKPQNFHKNEAGEVVAIKCAYHKLWMDPRVAEFGKKANSPTGLAVMCKEGTSNWTKQHRDFKQASQQILEDLKAGEISVDDIEARETELLKARDEVKPREDGYGFETLDECLADSQARGYEV